MSIRRRCGYCQSREAGPKPQARTLLLKLALGFIPGRHKTVLMPRMLKERILKARKDFQRYVQERGEIEMQFYDPQQYIQSRNIRDNILFGQPKAHRGGAVEAINQHLLQLLIEEGALEDIVDRGLDFQVGSMGEYLSGGQRQKIALARVFLKNPPSMSWMKPRPPWITPLRPGCRISSGRCGASTPFFPSCIVWIPF